MTNCQNVLEDLSDYIEGTLESEKFAIIAEHLNECADCREERDFLVTLFQLASFASVDTPKDLTARIMDKIRTAEAETKSPDPTPIEVLPAAVAESQPTPAKVFDFTKFFIGKKWMSGLVAACLIVLAIPLMSKLGAPKTDLDPAVPSNDGIMENAPMASPPPSIAPSVSSFGNEVPPDPRALPNSDTRSNDSPSLGESAAAEYTPREVIAEFSETSVRYFNQLIVDENFDLATFQTSVGVTNLLETNLKYYFLLSDELYSQLLNQVSNKNQIVPFEIDTVKLDPLAKKGIVVVLK